MRRLTIGQSLGGLTDAQAASVRAAGALLSRARRELDLTATVERTLRKNQFEDLKFIASDQWDQAIASGLQEDNRPKLTMNRLTQFIRQVVNQIRSQGLAMRVSPEGDGADVETAEVLRGLLHNIEVQSDAQTVYLTAVGHQVGIGRGYWRIDAEYTDDQGFQQELRLKRIRNPFSVYMDPTTEMLDTRDSRFGFVIEDVPKEEYAHRYKDSSISSLEAILAAGNQAPMWLPEGRIRIAQWWYTEPIEETLLLLEWPDGRQHSLLEKDFNALSSYVQDAIKVLNHRVVSRNEVKVAVINGAEILEGNEDKTAGRDWPGRWIPIIPVVGDEIDLNGEVDYRGMVRDAKEAQRLYNYEVTSLAETLSLAPRAPFIGWAGMFEGYEEKWRQANRRNFPYLEVNYRDEATGTPYPQLPQRNAVEAPVMGIINAIRQADGDLKSMMGLYEPSLGEQQSGRSGKAIMALQQQGQQANSNFIDNLSRAIRTTGTMLLDLIPHYYDVPHVRRVLGLDEKVRHVLVHANQPQENLPDRLAEGIDGIYDLGVGRYDVAVTAEPSLKTRRAETLQGLMGLVQAAPQIAGSIMDLIVGEMDWAKADIAEDRLKKMLPPQLQGEDGGVPPQIQQQLQQGQQQVQQLTAALQETQKQLTDKLHEQAAELALKHEQILSSERIAVLRSRTDLLLQQIKVAGAGEMHHAQARLDLLLDDLARSERALIRQQQQDDMTIDAEPSQPALPAGAGAPPAP